MCYRVVVVEMLSVDKKHYEALEKSQPSDLGDEIQASWNETAVIMVEGVSKLLTQNLNTMISSPNFVDLWAQLLEYFKELLNRKVLDVSTAVFTGMTKILREIEGIGRLGQASVTKVWNLWKDGIPVSHSRSSQRKKGNQDSIIAYLDWLHQLSRFMGSGMELQQVNVVTERLRSCVVDSDAAAYSADTDKMTPVQVYALESVRLVPTDIPNSLSKLVDSISDFVVLAYEEGYEEKGQTYIALSKSAMDMLRICIVDHVGSGKIRDPKLITRALVALKTPLRLKYQWRKEGKEPPTWKKATTTALAILEATIPMLKPVPESPEFWNSVTEISSCITSAKIESCRNHSSIPQDQDFDIAAYIRVRALITPLLGLSSVPDLARLAYTASLFSNSIIHIPHPDDLARPGQDLLQGLQSTHIGRTQELLPTPRTNLSYLLLDEIFSLVSVHQGSPEQLRLARAAAPFLILRAGVTFKAYIHDHPLRGRMPQPWSQKKELLYVLRKLVELDSEPGAIPDAPGITSRRKKHLHRLYGLVVQATGVMGGDEEVHEALRGFLNAVGEDFGV